jgi:hypothetical protein
MPSPPRDGSVCLGGMPWLARMIDKSRLSDIDKEVLDLDYPCPMDQQLLRKLGISSCDFQAITLANPADVDVLKALQAKGIAVEIS